MTSPWPHRLRAPSYIRTLRKWRNKLTERVSFHLYRGESLTEAKLRIGATHFRISRFQYKSGPAKWSARKFRADISSELVSTESWLSLLGRFDADKPSELERKAA